jgi:copper transport protein
MKKIAFLVLIFLALCGIGAMPVLAHALLLRSIPEANAVLDRAPAQVELFFSEAVDPAFSTIKVLDVNGQPVDNGDTQVDPADATHLTVSLRSLPDGIYTVSWKALSATDGHVTLGSFPFAVGNVDAAAIATAAQASKQIKLSIGEVAAKWLLYLSAMALVGSLLFGTVVWQPARRAAQIDRAITEPPWHRFVNLALIGLIVASIIGLLVQAGQASGGEIAAPWDTATNGVLFATRYGTLWIARLIFILVLIGLLLRRPLPFQVSRREQALTFGAALLMLMTISLGSHAAGEPQPTLPVAADVIHLLAASVWVGGLISFVLGVWSIRKIDAVVRTRFTAQLIPRFSVLALISVATLALTGLYSAVLQIGALDALWNTLYGKALIVKLFIVLSMIGLGAIHLLIVTPRIKQDTAVRSATSPWPDRFRRSVTIEVMLGVVLLLSVSVFTSLPPARSAPSASDLQAATDVDDLNIALDIAPGRVGVNTFTVNVTTNGHALDNAKTVEARFTPANGNIAPSQAQLSGQGNGAYAIKGAYLSLPDTWQVQVVVRRDNHFDAYADFTFSLGATATAANLPWNRLSGSLLFVAALLDMFAFRRFEFSRGSLIAIELIPALALVVIGTIVFAQAPIESGGPINPIPPNAASVAAGKAIYEEKCVPCHGESGKGDGPVGITLNPRPADLTQHAVPGVHTDGQLFGWITNGFPSSVMPPFRQALSDDERWNVVNFIRTLAPKSTP